MRRASKVKIILSTTAAAFLLYLVFTPKYVAIPGYGPPRAPEGECYGKPIILRHLEAVDAPTEAICLGWLQGKTTTSVFGDLLTQIKYRWLH